MLDIETSNHKMIIWSLSLKVMPSDMLLKMILNVKKQCKQIDGRLPKAERLTSKAYRNTV